MLDFPDLSSVSLLLLGDFPCKKKNWFSSFLVSGYGSDCYGLFLKIFVCLWTWLQVHMTECFFSFSF